MYDWIILILFVFLINLLPGVHANLLAVLLSHFFSMEQVAFGLGLHFILSIIPSIMYSISQEVASAPVINKLSQENRHATIFVFTFSALISSLFALTIDVDFDALYNWVRPYLFYIVLAISMLFFLMLNKDEKILFIISGAWGVFALNERIMFSLFSGLFAIPYLFFYVARQSSSENKPISFSPFPVIAGMLIGVFSLLLPGVSPPSVVSTLLPIFRGYDFLAYYGAISSTQYILAVDNYIQTSKLRNAYAMYIKFKDAKYFILLGIALGSIIIWVIGPHISMPDDPRIRFLILIVILGVSYTLEGFLGLLALLGSTILGTVSYRLKASPSSLLGILIIPTIILLTRHLG